MPKVDVIDWQMSIQYSWSAKTKEKVVNNLYQVSEYGTKLLISCIDGTMLREMISSSNSPNLTFKTSIDTTTTFTHIDDSMYQVVTGDRKLNEFYVDNDALVQDLANRGFMLISSGDFFDMISRSEKFFDQLYLLETQESTKKFFTLVASTKINNTLFQETLKYCKLIKYYYFIRLIK